MIDTDASRSLMSLELAKTIGNAIAPNPSRLTGLIANEMPTKGIVKAEVKIGNCVVSDELVVVKDLYPEIKIGLKFIIENKRTTDLVEQKLTIPKDDVFIIKVPMQVASGHVPPPEDDAFVCETLPGPDTMSATSEINEKLEQEVDEILNLSTPGLENTEIKEKLRICVLSALGSVRNRGRSRATHRHRRCETFQNCALQNSSAQSRGSS